MLRGIRWQLAALLITAGVFLVVVLARPTPTPAPTPAPTTVAASASATPTPESGGSAAPSATPSPTLPPQLPVQPAQPSAALPVDVPTYREALVGRVQRLNPLLANLNPVDADITSLMFEGLTRLNPFGEPVPALARSWLVSSDGLEYVVTLRDDVLWHDGTRFTAADVAFTMQLLRARDFAGDESLRDFWRTVETEQLGEFLVRFRLTQALGAFPEALRVGILPKHALDGMPASQLATHPFNLSPIGTGAYQLEALRGSDGVVQQVDLRVSPNYRLRAEGQVGYALERVSFRLYDTFEAALAALDAGEVDGLAARERQERAPLQQRATNGTVIIRNGLEPVGGFLIFNLADDAFPLFREERVRRALLLGANRQSAVTRHLFNQAVPAESPLVMGGWAYAADVRAAFDPNQAAFVLGQARIDLGPTPEPQPTAEGAVPTPTPDPATLPVAAFTVITPDDPALRAMLDQMIGQWATLGFAVTVEAVPADQYAARLDAGQFQAAVVELSLWGTADPDVYAFWHDSQYPDGQNYGNANDRVVSELLERARRDPNGINRAAEYRQFQQQFLDRAIAIPLYNPIYTYAFAPRVQNVQIGYLGTRADRLSTISGWTLAE
ncbi:MAG: ABC transporter substrate-binding protein [Anaerolineae bacterium]|jgi:peptide/nickel transport system substrate-binding protein|nr:ABC transporter substrate-binding protein [Anaerolineae bacterium]